jgi:hypothetical protein
MMSIFMTTATFSSCGDDDEVISGAEQVANINKALEDCFFYIDDDDDAELYYVVADDEAEAKEICSSITGQTWNGKTTVITLNDNYGTISIIPGTEDGYYAQVTYDSEKISYERIRIVSQEYLDSSNIRFR